MARKLYKYSDDKGTVIGAFYGDTDKSGGITASDLGWTEFAENDARPYFIVTPKVRKVGLTARYVRVRTDTFTGTLIVGTKDKLGTAAGKTGVSMVSGERLNFPAAP